MRSFSTSGPYPRVLGLLLPALLLWGCGGAEEASQESADLPDPAWVRLYDPDGAWNGYTLTLHQRRIPVLLDMNGRPVHSWPEARMKSRVRLLPNGSILGLGLGRGVVEYDWEGRKTWEFRTPGAFPHHDLQRLANGNTLVVLKVLGEPADTLVEVDRGGEVVWTWKALEHLGSYLPKAPSEPGDVTHLNSVQELPENPLFEAGDGRFRPGNLLVSARNLDAVFVIERPSGEVLWWFAEGLDHQHEALMNASGEPFPGRIQIFNNRRKSFRSDRRSEILELDPRDGSVPWRYRVPGFFSATGGTQQALPNGNLLITSTWGRRVFEIDRSGKTVWQWTPPYQTVRALRVAPDACPQLPSLRARRTQAVEPPPGYLHVDAEAYRFARRGSRKQVVVDGEERLILKKERDCRRLFLPVKGELDLSFGIDRQRWLSFGALPSGVEFVADLELPGGDRGEELLREVVGSEGPAWRRRTVSLAAYGGREVKLCLKIQVADSQDRFAYWEQPVIRSSQDLVPGTGAREEEAREEAEEEAGEDLTAEELEVRRQHLKSLGYVD